MTHTPAQALEIRPLLRSRVMEIDWADGQQSRISFTTLRVECPCAECKGHTPEEAKVITGKEEIQLSDIQPVGNYAVQLHFSDGHGTGIFTWEYLRLLGDQHPAGAPQQ